MASTISSSYCYLLLIIFFVTTGAATRIKGPAPSPVASEFPSNNLERDYHTIQEFRKKLIGNPAYDPKGIAKTWNNKDVCKYQGFMCEELPGLKVQAVASADFNGYLFAGPDLKLTGFLEKLSDLAIFHANSNNFTGSIPPNLGLLPHLFELDLSNNKLTGGFPMSVLMAKQLSFLDIRFNHFSGPIPEEVFTLHLEALFLNNNNFSQSLPDNLGSTPAAFLTFANNKFTGSIPKTIGNCTNLREVLFLNNQLTGCLPSEVGFLSNLLVFDAGTNNLTGPIPNSFSCLKKLQILNLGSNQLYGPVPETLCQLPNVELLSLSGNYFTKVGPKCMELMKKKKIDVRKNCILGLPEQRSKAECEEFLSKKKKSCPNLRPKNYISCRNPLEKPGAPQPYVTYTALKSQK